MAKIALFHNGLASGLALLFATSCASSRFSRNVPVDRTQLDEIRHIACRLDTRYCGALRVVLFRSRTPRAELRPDGVLLVSAGMLDRIPDPSALAFVVAHELAHARLEHFAVGPAARDAGLELAADAFAADALLRAGFDGGAGLRLLESLRREAEAAPNRGSVTDLAELDQRIEALRARAAQQGR